MDLELHEFAPYVEENCYVYVQVDHFFFNPRIASTFAVCDLGGQPIFQERREECTKLMLTT